jgi:hypothetical protein
MHLFNVINDYNDEAQAINAKGSYLPRTVVETIESPK